MIDWVVVSVALGIFSILVGIFGFMAWKINMPDPLISTNLSGKKDEINQFIDSDKKKKDKYGNDQSKKKRKDQKKSKRDNKEDQQQHTVKFKEPVIQTSEETDNEREESEQESTPQIIETSSKVRKRNRNKARPTTPPSSSSTRSTGPIEGILANKNEKSPVTTRAQPMPHPKLALITPKDEVELAKQHQLQGKAQGKSTQASNKQTASTPPATVKKSIPLSTNVDQGSQKQQQQILLQEQQEQPFTTVGGNRHKAGTPPSQQQQQQQQNKSVNVTTPTTPVSASSIQHQAPVQAQHEQLPQRQPPRQQKETPAQLNGFNANQLPAKQPAVVAAAATAAAPPTKMADLIKALPTSQAVVTELMLALDAFPLSTDELDIIMHKIANKQSVVKQDWTKLQHGQKVDPQAHIGQALDESARAYQEDMKTNAMKHIKELTDELNNDKRRIQELLNEKNVKDIDIQVLHAQLNACQQPQQQLQTYQAEFKRLTEENMQLKQRLTQQQQQISSINLPYNNNNTNNDSANIQVRVLSEQIKKLSVDNGNLEKQLKTKELLIQEGQKEKDDLFRSNQQLIQKTQENQKKFQHNEEKLLKELNDNRTLNINQLNDYKHRIEQLEKDNEQLKQAEIIHVQPTNLLNNEEREKLEQLNQENEQIKKQFNEIQTQYQSQENELRKELEQLKKNFEQLQQDQTLKNELETKNAQIDALKIELDEAKANNDSVNSQFDERLQQEQNKQKQFLIEFLEEDVRKQLPNDNQDFNQWLSSYQQIFISNIQSNKQALQDECTTLKHENDRLHQNMTDVENQLKEIEQTVQSKEEELLTHLKSKDITLEHTRDENDQLNTEIQRLRAEIDRLQSTHDTAINDIRTLKLQLDERHPISAHNSSTTGDDSFEFVKQPSPSTIEIDSRANELNELIRSSKEALENQDSLVQQLDKHLNDIHRSGTGGLSTENIDESTVSSSSPSDQQQQQVES